jgi:hypothetical protein
MRLALAALLLTGCIRHIPFGTEQLTNLNGFGEATEAAPEATPAPEAEQPAETAPAETAPAETAPPAPAPVAKEYTLVDRDGEAHPFTSASKLYLVDDQGHRKGGEFKLVQLDSKILTGELADGTQLKANLDKVDHAELDVRDVGTAVAMGVSLGLALIAVVAIGAMAMNNLP